MAAGASSDFAYPGRSRAVLSPPLITNLLEPTVYQTAPPVTRLLYRDSRLHYNFRATETPHSSGLSLGALGKDDLFPLRRIVHQMRMASLRPPESVRNEKRASDLVSYCDYLQGKRQPNILTSLFDLVGPPPSGAS
jgi:hypothetical protein